MAVLTARSENVFGQIVVLVERCSLAPDVVQQAVGRQAAAAAAADG